MRDLANELNLSLEIELLHQIIGPKRFIKINRLENSQKLNIF